MSSRKIIRNVLIVFVAAFAFTALTVAIFAGRGTNIESSELADINSVAADSSVPEPPKEVELPPPPTVEVVAMTIRDESHAEPIVAEEVVEVSKEEPDPSDRYASIDIQPGDRDLLALLSYHESRGQGGDGYGVVEVVLNRCLSSEFPDTVYGVITQTDPVQFCSAEELWGQSIDEPDCLARCYEIVDDVLDNHNYVLPDYYVWQNSVAPTNWSDYAYFGVGNYFS